MLNLFMAMLLDAFDSISIKNEKKVDAEDDDLSLKIKMIKDGIVKLGERIKSIFVKLALVIIKKSMCSIKFFLNKLNF